MLKNLRQRAYTLLLNTGSSIAFLPSLICAFSFLLAVILLTIESSTFDTFITNTTLIKIHSIDTLRSILTTFLTGLISMTIFSFSMVMLVLSQAASHYSPKILNWMVGKKNNQFILGIYLGSIIFTLVLLLQLPKNPELKPSYHLALIIAAILTFYSLMLFVSFINNVSNDIQISKIIENIYNKTLKRLKKENSEQKNIYSDSNTPVQWFEYNSQESGYLQKIRSQEMLHILQEHDLKINIVQNFGYFHIRDNPLFKLDKNIDDENLIKDISSLFIFYSGEKIEDHTFYGFRQLSEIAIKALSPGINDPGTAITCIDYLINLLVLQIEITPIEVIRDNKGVDRIHVHNYSFGELIETCLMPILRHGSSDIKIIEHLMLSIKKIANRDKEKEHQLTVNNLMQAILIESENFSDNIYYKNYLKRKEAEINTGLDDYFQILNT